MASKASSNVPSSPGETANGNNRRLGITVFSGGMFNCGFEYYEERSLRLWYLFNAISESSCPIRLAVSKRRDVCVLCI